MNLASVTWTILIVLYVSFFSWYTSCSGPLTPEEIDHYVGLMAASDAGNADRLPDLRAFLEADTGDDFVMVNVIEMRDTPGHVEGADPDMSASDMLGAYMEFMVPALFSRACHPVLFTSAAAPAFEVWGIDGARKWTTAGLMRYRSRRDMMDIATNPAFQGRHEFKIAAIHKTIAFPGDPWFHLGDPRLVLGLLLAVIGLLVHGAEGHRRARARAGYGTASEVASLSSQP